MGQSRVALLGKDAPFPAKRALSWPICEALSVTQLPAWTTRLAREPRGLPEGIRAVQDPFY